LAIVVATAALVISIGE